MISDEELKERMYEQRATPTNNMVRAGGEIFGDIGAYTNNIKKEDEYGWIKEWTITVDEPDDRYKSLLRLKEDAPQYIRDKFKALAELIV